MPSYTFSVDYIEKVRDEGKHQENKILYQLKQNIMRKKAEWYTTKRRNMREKTKKVKEKFGDII